MIRILKPSAAPVVLQGRGRSKRNEHCASYDQHSAEYDAGKRKFTFDATIYGDASVKQALINAQHGKCCFCETIVREEGDIEHFRPKAGFRQEPRTRMEKPGYYWLAYDWDNLLLACPICNQRHKKNLFPLINPDKRVKNHHGDVSQEEPLFINPAKTDPVGYIAFRQEMPYAIGGNRHAKKTIEALGLKRRVLSEERLKHLHILNTYQNILDLESKLVGNEQGRRLVAKARNFLAEATLDKAKFTAMSRAAAAVDYRVTLR